MKELRCLRCDRPMDFMMHEKIQLGEASPWLGQRSNVIAGALEADIYVCPGCGKLELFHAAGVRPEEPEEPEPLSPLSARCPDCEAIVGLYSVICPECGKTGPFIPQIRCPACGSLHDFDDLQCPYCSKKE